jgi:demethylmenaquinone methyltransferase/2-methoxy-6-polyprenyl-1,4-benzoquinol methylase
MQRAEFKLKSESKQELESLQESNAKQESEFMQQEAESKTHFGYQTIASSEKTERVGQVFDSVASRYDLMNDLMSLGMQRFWKRLAVTKANIQSHHQVLDLAGGTGDLTALIAKKLNSTGQVILADINDKMLNRGRARLIDQGILKSVEFMQANAESLPFQDNYFHCVTIAFGLRNVTHQDKALAEMFRVLKPGGRVIILEFSRTQNPLLTKLYDRYSFSVLPWLGKVVCQDEESYRYLAESIRKHPDQDTLKQMMETAGFERVDYQNIHDGIVALHRGYKF